jgi:hypothetical protein
VDSWGQVGGLKSLHVQLVLQSAQLILIQLMVVVSWTNLVWELLGVNLIEEVTELSRHFTFLGIDPK